MRQGDKIWVAINANNADGTPAGQMLAAQVIVGPVESRTVTRPSRDGIEPDRNFINPFGPVITQHPITKELYYRPMENLNFSTPRVENQVGLDVDETGKAIPLDHLLVQVTENNMRRLERARQTRVAAQPVALDVSALNAQLAQASESGVDLTEADAPLGEPATKKGTKPAAQAVPA